MSEKKDKSAKVEATRSMARLYCQKSGGQSWGNWAPKSKGYRCTVCSSVGHSQVK